ncbi:MAG: aldehyde dehydrogenase family protein [Planctomycetota bacterium]|nr:aldehyde dehydrogenase family protein [Planctomycetota bacterium]
MSEVREILKRLGIRPVNSGAYAGEWLDTTGAVIESRNPHNGEVLAKVTSASADDYEKVAEYAEQAFRELRLIPAPKRGEIIRQLGEELRIAKKDLGALVTLEMGKIRVEGEGEVQEMIDICDFAVGLSRQLYGNTMKSERPDHRMFEQWQPLGVVGIISAFNFPVAVWSWNSAIAAVCGDSMIWKPSSKVPLCGVAVQHICNRVCERNDVPNVFCLAVGDRNSVGERLISDRRVRLVSATGSCKMGRRIGSVVGERLARTVLELGGNNGIIVTPDADRDLTLRGVLFGSVGTAGQRCTTTRRLFLHESFADEFIGKLKTAYAQIKIGDPMAPDTLMGPLVDSGAVEDYHAALKRVKELGGKVIYGGEELRSDQYSGGAYVLPTIVEAQNHWDIVQEETFAPILYIIRYNGLDEAIRMQMDVPQGLSSAIFTGSLKASEKFLSPAGSDCGIANVNIGTSGAEIGGAFGGEKDTGGGREAGSDSWKLYMRRQTNTINYGDDLPLAQGIDFG